MPHATCSYYSQHNVRFLKFVLQQCVAAVWERQYYQTSTNLPYTNYSTESRIKNFHVSCLSTLAIWDQPMRAGATVVAYFLKIKILCALSYSSRIQKQSGTAQILANNLHKNISLSTVECYITSSQCDDKVRASIFAFVK